MSASAANLGLIQPLRRERALLGCVLASIALHALVLLGLSWGEESAPPRKALLVLTARLAPVATAPREQLQPSQLLPPSSTKPVPEARPQPSKPALKPAPAVEKTVPAEAMKTAPAESAPSAPATATASAAPAAPDPARSAPQAPAGVTTEAGARSGSEADAGSLEQYRLALIVATRRYKRYPAIAMEKGWQGRVEVHMVIGANGMIASASIKTSSGHEILDNQALDMLKKGKTTVQIPASLRGREFSIDVPVIFNLDNPNA